MPLSDKTGSFKKKIYSWKVLKISKILLNGDIRFIGT